MARDQNWILKFKLTYFIPDNLASGKENSQLVSDHRGQSSVYSMPQSIGADLI